jgi:hypothetical protein
LVGAVIAWLLLFLCEFICAQTLPNDEPDAYKPSASTDRKKITISDERVLPEISLGGMRPGSFESFILEVDTKLVEKSECIQIAKSCGCTQVSLLEGNTIKAGEKLKIALRIEAGASLGVRESQFYLAFRTPEGYVQLTQPLRFSVEREFDFGSGESLIVSLFENDQNKLVSIVNNSGERLGEVYATFDTESRERIKLEAFTINPDSGKQKIEVQIGILRRLLDKTMSDGMNGQLSLFASTTAQNTADPHAEFNLFRRKVVIPTTVQAGVKMRVLPASLFLDSATTAVTLRVLISEKTSGIESGKFESTVEIRNAPLKYTMKLISPFWIEYKIPIEELRGSGGEEIHLNIKSENLQGKFKIPFSVNN